MIVGLIFLDIVTVIGRRPIYTVPITSYRSKGIPEVWGEDNPPGLARHQAPVIIELRAGTTPARKRQYPIPIGARIGILPHISRLKQAGILVECQTAWNTSKLPVKKEGGQDYRPVQELRLVNQATVTLHLSVPKPLYLLSLLPPKTRIYTCLDLEDPFSVYA